jgi:hypothetical protein
MVRSETPGPAGDDQSLGDLVALAAKDVSQLIRYEIDLAKTELKDDVQRIGLAGAPLEGVVLDASTARKRARDEAFRARHGAEFSFLGHA